VIAFVRPEAAGLAVLLDDRVPVGGVLELVGMVRMDERFQGGWEHGGCRGAKGFTSKRLERPSLSLIMVLNRKGKRRGKSDAHRIDRARATPGATGPPSGGNRSADEGGVRADREAAVRPKPFRVDTTDDVG